MSSLDMSPKGLIKLHTVYKMGKLDPDFLSSSIMTTKADDARNLSGKSTSTDKFIQAPKPNPLKNLRDINSAMATLLPDLVSDKNFDTLLRLRNVDEVLEDLSRRISALSASSKSDVEEEAEEVDLLSPFHFDIAFSNLIRLLAEDATPERPSDQLTASPVSSKFDDKGGASLVSLLSLLDADTAKRLSRQPSDPVFLKLLVQDGANKVSRSGSDDTRLRLLDAKAASERRSPRSALSISPESDKEGGNMVARRTDPGIDTLLRLLDGDAVPDRFSHRPSTPSVSPKADREEPNIAALLPRNPSSLLRLLNEDAVPKPISSHYSSRPASSKIDEKEGASVATLFSRLLSDPGFDAFLRLFDADATPQLPSQYPSARSFYPKFIVKEEANSYKLNGELPGVEQKDIDIEFVDTSILVIKARRIEREYAKSNEHEFKQRKSGSLIKDDVVNELKNDHEPVKQGKVIEEDNSDTQSKSDAENELKNDHEPIKQGKVIEEDKSGTLIKTPVNNELKFEKSSTDVTESEKKDGAVEKRHSAEPACSYCVSERVIAEFQRSFSFPGKVDHNGVEADLKNGILIVVVPKQKAPHRKIVVRS